VLLIEDDPATVLVLHEVLNEEGYAIHVAINLDAAVTMLRSQPYDLVITDLLRPHGMTQLEAAKHLRDALGGIPTILVTAYREARSWDPAAMGFVAILIKPFDLDDFLDLVAAHFRPTHDGYGAA
jgi:CheY-like chemotaxis protein